MAGGSRQRAGGAGPNGGTRGAGPKARESSIHDASRRPYQARPQWRRAARPQQLGGLRAIVLLALFLGASCTPAEAPLEPTSTLPLTPTRSANPEATDSVISEEPATAYGLTYQNLDGNRFVNGTGRLPGANVNEIEVQNRPRWIVGVPWEGGVYWVVVQDGGSMDAFLLTADGLEQRPVPDHRAEDEGPPILGLREGGLVMLRAENGASPLTHPVPLGLHGLAFSTLEGEVVLAFGDNQTHLAGAALPDARLLLDRSGRLLFLSRPTDRYPHAVLGDGLEAGAFSLVTMLGGAAIRTFEIAPPAVIEGIAPIWSDLDGDGIEDIIVTVSAESVGARVVVFNDRGETIAESQPIGRGFRWLHQIAVAPFAPGVGLELAVVRTPHIGGVLTFYRLENGLLVQTAELAGFRSHLIGDRNLDMALAADLDGDGAVELLLPRFSLDSLAAVRRSGSGAEIVWELELPGTLATNLAAVATAHGDLVLAAGTDNGIVRFWGP